MPTLLPEPKLPDPAPSRAQMAAIFSGYAVLLVVVGCLVSFDARVAVWIADAAQAEFVADGPVDTPPIRLAQQK